MISEESTVIVTGATGGIGLQTARELVGRVRRVIVQGPEPETTVRPALQVLGEGTAEVRYVRCDFESLADVADAADTMTALAAGPIDAVVNNAGVPGAMTRQATKDEHERTLQVNFLAMVLLTERLLPALADDARVVNLASATHEMTDLDLADIELERGYDAVRAYARSKLAIILYTRWLADRLADDGVTPVSLSPGVISTPLLHAMFNIGGVSVRHGADNVLAAVTGPVRAGDYFDDGELVEPSAQARDARLGRALMDYAFGALRPHLS
ncbi:SDR family NAD(P)-dependent oxidoreductase [Promicromonospora sp. NPDC090134]|uniref:SDR family NAD(P)-dependent oxidoreductase n=1 Tax=Promicromonospora sp. NPDC090134 TaxID=3364408 RepID=UPI0038290C9D